MILRRKFAVGKKICCIQGKHECTCGKTTYFSEPPDSSTQCWVADNNMQPCQHSINNSFRSFSFSGLSSSPGIGLCIQSRKANPQRFEAELQVEKKYQLFLKGTRLYAVVTLEKRRHIMKKIFLLLNYEKKKKTLQSSQLTHAHTVES